MTKGRRKAKVRRMKQEQEIECPYCRGTDLQKNGCRGKGRQRYICKKCGKSFQLHYKNTACKVGVKEQIAELTVNGCGVRSIARALGINKNTVVSELKKQTPHVNPHVIDMIEHNQLKRLDIHIYYTAEMDELWSFVGKKAINDGRGMQWIKVQAL